VPVDVPEVIDTLQRLQVRTEQVTQAKQGLTRKYTINGQTRTAYAWLFGQSAAAVGSPFSTLVTEHPERLSADRMAGMLRHGASAQAVSASSAGTRPTSLRRPQQFSIGWTTFPGIYDAGLPHLATWASALTDADVATEQFWPLLASYGFGYNLILPQRVTSVTHRALRHKFKRVWTRKLETAARNGNLYVIDMSRFEALQPHFTHGATRFTPATITLLTRDARTKSFTPVAIMVSGYKGRSRTLYSRATATNGAWLYALQAAKASVTVFGVWLGHVYQWHLVTAAMQMALRNTLPSSHPIYQMLAPQCKYLIGFDAVLLTQWSAIAPPTSIASGLEYLSLANDFAVGRSYFDDDPKVILRHLGLHRAQFTHRTGWDRYPVVKTFLAVWDLVESYTRRCVRASYPSDASVAADGLLQAWMAAASASGGGNLRGLPRLNSRAALERVLTSLLYRITVHGIARLQSTSNPAGTFLPNFPHCLQRSDIPGPRTRISTRTLLTYLPNTVTIADALNFYFIFAFSTPYEPFIPLGGANTELFFPGGPGEPRNSALIDLRNGLARVIDQYQPDPPQRFQWPRNIET
jgi:hypothetical protein